MSIADTGRFWETLVIPVLQILEDSGKYWLYQYCRTTKLRNVLVYCFFLSCLRLLWEDGQCIGKPGERRIGAGERRRGGPPILFKKKLNYVLLCFIKLQFKPKCHSIDTIMYKSLIPVYCFFCPVCASVMRGRTVYRETGRKETRGGRKEKRGRKKREGRKVKRCGRNEKRGRRINSPMIKQDM